ncbi:uncharacterized protein LOC125855100 [Solanum stenotomum]|uniref:uncharacterized protein LOC125855100 n=1 Tax=Solanum stenotomum TaxID=172797 RepID=UPI0020CFE9E7|nr:uncharacterized protein LOC125855100 [Solanum stenotomum]
MAAARLRDFIWMNLPEFYGSKVVEDPQKLIDEVYMILSIMGVTPVRWRGRSMFRQKFSEQGSLNASPRCNNERVFNYKPQGDSNKSMMPTCAKCRINHEGKCLAGSNAFFGCGKADHKIRNCPLVAKNEGDYFRKAHPNPSFGPSGSGASSSKQNRFYALQTKGDQESSLDMVIGMLKVFQLVVYAFLDPGATLTFVTPYVAMRFDVLPDVLLEPFSISTPVGHSVLAGRIVELV